jgi:hypothetical protein
VAHLISPLTPEALPELSRFLKQGLGDSGGSVFAEVDVLRWKYFDPTVPFASPRGLVVRADGRIVGHAGICPTALQIVGAADNPVSAACVIDWLAEASGAPSGVGLLLRTLQFADAQYTLGCTPAADRVIRKLGYRVMSQIPLYQKVLRARAWPRLHQQQPAWKWVALTGADLVETIRHCRRRSGVVVELESVASFDERVRALSSRWPTRFLCSDRSPALLNHFLRFPGGSITGWWLRAGGELCGWALLSRVTRNTLQVGKVVDCLLDPDRGELWTAAMTALTNELRRQGCDLAVCYGGTPWLRAALAANGFSRRGKSTFYLRDPRSRLPTDCPLHLTHLEADLAYLP